MTFWKQRKHGSIAKTLKKSPSCYQVYGWCNLTRIFLHNFVSLCFIVFYEISIKKTILFWEPRWYSGNVDITDWMLRLFGVPSSILLNVKTVQMLFNIVWSFLLTVWTTVRLCAELITRHTKSQTHLKLGEVSSRRSYPPHEGFLVPLHFFLFWV